MSDSELTTLKGRWETPSEGPDEPRRRLLIDLAFRLAASVQPRFNPPHTRREVSSSMESDEEWGGYYSTQVYRLGDEEHGLEITERVTDPQDGMTPLESSIEISACGLPGGWSLALNGYFTPPMRGPSQPMSLEARLPGPEAGNVTAILRQEVGAEVEVS